MKTLIVIVLSTFFWTNILGQGKLKVFVFTDINLVGGDPDDRQSFIHLLWYSDKLDIVGIVPDYWKGKGYEACINGLEAYQKDYQKYGFAKKGLTNPEKIKSLIFDTKEKAIKALKEAADSYDDPVYVLVWGSMATLRDVLFQHPEIVESLRVLTIGTGVKYGPKDEVAGEDCTVVNWNGSGRNQIFNDSKFHDLWWIESNWTYNGMFEGEGPREMFAKLSAYGAMRRHIKEVTKGHDWAQYFRVGDTPTVTYLIDHTHNIENPEKSSWAGLFKKPFPEARPNYFTDDNGPVEWDYEDPCNTWGNLQKMYQYNKSTLVDEREAMYKELIDKLNLLYDNE